jgi:imidazolonepropionase-like amidohydrolase
MRKLLVATMIALCLAGATRSQTLVITGATIIDGNGGTPIRDGVIVVNEKRIVAVGRRSSVRVPAGAQEIPVNGKFVLPGLMDANVHLIHWMNWDHIEFLARYENQLEPLIEEAAQTSLKYGVTTVFDSMGPLRPLMQVRDRINKGEVIGSRLYVAGNIVGFRAVFDLDSIRSVSLPFQERYNALFEENMGPGLPWMAPEQIREETRKYIALGIDFLKYGATGDGFPINSEIGQEAVLRFSPEQQKAMIEECHKAGIIVQTHQSSVESLREVLEASVDMVQHGSHTGPTPMPESTMQMFLSKQIYSGIQTNTQRKTKLQIEHAQHEFPPDPLRAQSIRVQHENEVRMIRAGVPMLLATDAGVNDPDIYASRSDFQKLDWMLVLGEGHYLWMRAMVQQGMTPMTVIQSATKNIAAAYHKLNQVGTLEPGKFADLIVVDADPLQDIENMRKLSLVLKEGKVIDTKALPLNPILTSEAAKVPGLARMK